MFGKWCHNWHWVIYIIHGLVYRLQSLKAVVSYSEIPSFTISESNPCNYWSCNELAWNETPLIMLILKTAAGIVHWTREWLSSLHNRSLTWLQVVPFCTESRLLCCDIASLCLHSFPRPPKTADFFFKFDYVSCRVMRYRFCLSWVIAK